MTWQLRNIPQIANFYWGNDNKLSYLRFLTIKTFSNYNLNWKLRLYTSSGSSKPTWLSTENKINFTGKDYTHLLKDIPNLEIIEFDFTKIGVSNDISDVFKSDFLRWYLFTQDGGLWCDMDIIFFKSIDEGNLTNNLNVNLIFCKGRYGHSIGFLGSSAHNKLYEWIFNEAKNKFDNKLYQTIGADLLNSTDIFKLIHNFNYKSTFIAPETVYPLDAIRIRHIYNADLPLDNPKTIGLHWYAGDIMAVKYINEIDDTNYTHYMNHTTGEVYRINTLLSLLKRIKI